MWARTQRVSETDMESSNGQLHEDAAFATLGLSISEPSPGHGRSEQLPMPSINDALMPSDDLPWKLFVEDSLIGG